MLQRTEESDPSAPGASRHSAPSLHPEPSPGPASLPHPSTQPRTSTTCSTLTIGCSCPAGRPAWAASASGPPGRGIQRGAGSDCPGGRAQEGSGILGAGKGGLGAVLGGEGTAGVLFRALPHLPRSAHCSFCWLRGPGRRVGMGARVPPGTAQHSHAHGLPRSLRGEDRVGRAPEGPRTKHWGSPVGGPSQLTSLYLCHLGTAASCRVPSRGKAQGTGHLHSWVEGPHSSSGDSGGHLHRRHCRAPRDPTLPMPQPL